MKTHVIFITSSLLILISFRYFREFLVTEDSISNFEGRILYDADGSLLIVDSNGNQYEPYSTAWRYLGMYLDCGDNDNNGGSQDNNNVCYRKVLWAAVSKLTHQKSARLTLQSMLILGIVGEVSVNINFTIYHQENGMYRPVKLDDVRGWTVMNLILISN